MKSSAISISFWHKILWTLVMWILRRGRLNLWALGQCPGPTTSGGPLPLFKPNKNGPKFPENVHLPVGLQIFWKVYITFTLITWTFSKKFTVHLTSWITSIILQMISDIGKFPLEVFQPSVESHWACLQSTKIYQKADRLLAMKCHSGNNSNVFMEVWLLDEIQLWKVSHHMLINVTSGLIHWSQ